MIFKREIFEDDATKRIITLEAPIDGTPGVFRGGGVIPFEHRGAERRLNFTFPIPGATPEEAFANLPEAFDTASQKAQADLAEELKAEDDRERMTIVGPAGRPITKYR